MITNDRFLKPYIPYASPIASLVVAATNTLVFNSSTDRTFRIVKIHIFNHNAAATIVTLGDLSGAGATWVQKVTGIWVAAGLDLILTEPEIIGIEFPVNQDLYARASVAAAAPNNVEVQVEVHEYLGIGG